MDSPEVIGSVPELTSPVVAISFQPLGRRGQVPAGISVLEAARRLGVGLSGVCGGLGACGTCRV
ncbi:MAG: 2Fe-2S iron-sulfur cluster-binding protein, partial [Anaerolineae bacterium]